MYLRHDVLAVQTHIHYIHGLSIPEINFCERYASFDTHVGMLYDILCHMAYCIKCMKRSIYIMEE